MTYKDFFDPQVLDDAWDKYTNEDNYAVLCRMPPTLFSSLAEQRLFPGAMADLPKPDKGGPKWNSLPALAIGDCRYDSMIIDFCQAWIVTLRQALNSVSVLGSKLHSFCTETH